MEDTGIEYFVKFYLMTLFRCRTDLQLNKTEKTKVNYKKEWI